MSTMKVGRLSCSSSSATPRDASNLSGSCLSRSRPSGDAVLGRLERSELLLLDSPGGLMPAKVPRASVTVLMPLSSPCALLSILAAASEEEKRAGRGGRRRVVLEKNKGDVG